MQAGFRYKEAGEFIAARVPNSQPKAIFKIKLVPKFTTKFLNAMGSPELTWAWATTGLTPAASKEWINHGWSLQEVGGWARQRFNQTETRK